MRKLYQWRGYSTDVVREDPSGVTLMASEHGRVLATVSVGLDSREGLAADSLYGVENGRLRRDGLRLCEFTRLAVDRASHSLELLGMLFHVAFPYARRVRRASHLPVEVDPRHVRFCQRMLGFGVAGPQRTCRRVDAPAVLLLLSLDHAEDEIAAYGGQPEIALAKRSLYPFFFAPAQQQEIVRGLFGDEARHMYRGCGRVLHA